MWRPGPREESPLSRSTFDPTTVYGADDGRPPARALIAPHHYVQGPGVLTRLGDLLALAGSERPALLLTGGGRRRIGERLRAGLSRGTVEATVVTFRGECSLPEVERILREIGAVAEPVDGVVSVGGGKCLDAGKCVAGRLRVPAVSCPSIASTDAPCSAVSVLYTEEGRFEGVEHFRDNPALVLVDTEVIARAPVRYLVAGMGDALATRYEARTCFRNPEARTLLGVRMTVAGVSLAEACGETLVEHAEGAVRDVRRGRVTEDVERVVEANTLLSGMGFEGGGIAAAHAVATGGLAAVPAAHRYHHGERVAFGLLTQLALEDEGEETSEVARFLASVGLPVRLGQLGLERSDEDALTTVAEVAARAPAMENEPFEVTPARVVEAMLRADAIGREALRGTGDGAYEALHGGA